MKLNIGCGRDIKSGYVNMDLYPVGPSVVSGDAQDLPFDDNSIEEIYARDVLEHITHTKTLPTLRHWFAKLKPGGKLFIQSTCLKLLCKYALSKISAGDPNGVKDAICRFFGRQTHPSRIHYTSMDRVMMDKLLLEAGFTAEPKYESGFGNGTNMRITILKQKES
jgi:predicted SAM-dependent methyltransferase